MPTSSTNPKLYHVPSEDSTKFCPVFKKALLFDPKYLDKKPPFQPCSSSKDTRALERDREGGAGSSNFIANGTKSAKNEISKHMQLLNVYEDALGGPSFGPSAAFQAEERRTIRCLERDVLLASKKKSERGGQARKQGGAVSKEKVVYYAKDAKSKPVVERMDIRPYPPNPNNLTPQQMQQRAAAARFLKPLSETIGSVEHAQNLRLSPSFLRDVLPSMSVSRLVEIGTVPPDGVKPDEDPREQLIKALEALEGLEEGQGQLIVKDREPPTPGSTVRRASVVRRQSVLAQANLRSARGSIGSARGMPPSVKTPSRHPAEKMGMAGALAYADDSLLQQHINWVPVYACQLASAAVEYRTGRGGAFLMSGEGKGDAADEGDPSRMEDPLTYTDEGGARGDGRVGRQDTDPATTQIVTVFPFFWGLHGERNRLAEAP
uniref:Uncharacterized protein n=1 Tax=Chromera velia CCMP2878 TaxID=1169474 RepID=A0A0K6S799_9ALVE|eukprot:Cvel_542.t2-p1 / transcript=Cvel_542.t2 / gene=Cvel_542 / organism=Chromera_velia_CCMP2878 / gene_product=hypothetical protein / transcript_product=hypothetical protein / location=Cvel_scaffold17:19385-22102(+) / protein_length=433 / sequence_SO=supercontig / SO=protein_coding / is_pseudo=false